MILTESTPEGMLILPQQRDKAVVLKTGADGAWFKKTADGEQALSLR